MTARRARAGALLRALALGCCAHAGCGTPLEPAWLVRGPRVLAVVAQPAEAHPGDRVALFAAVTDPLEAASPQRFEWTVCARFEEASTTLPVSSFGQLLPERGCESAGAADVRPLASATQRAELVVPSDALENDAWLAAAFGAQLSPARRRELAQRVGLPLVVTLRMHEGERSVLAFKRLTVLPATHPQARNANPTLPAFTVGSQRVAPVAEARDEPSDRCAASDGRALEVAPGASVLVAPGDDALAGLERYEVLDAEGRATPVREEAFYNFFATAGRLELGRARSPERAPTWIAPMEPGPVTHWLTLRDGRGGTAVCRYVVTVR